MKGNVNMATKHIFVINPMAGKGKAVTELEDALKPFGAGYDIEVYRTTGVGDATNFVCDKLQNSSEDEFFRFYSCGGDGSLNEVVNGVMRSGKNNYAVCPYPCGSGNDFVKALGGREKYLDIANILEADAECIDVIRAGSVYSVNAVHFGLDTKVARVMQQVKRKPIIGGRNAYTTGVAAAFLSSMRYDCTLVADGETIHSGDFLLCTLANGQYVGGKYKCAPRSAYNDGLIEVCMVRPVSHLRFLSLVKYYEEGTHLDSDKFADIITYRRAKKLTLSSKEKDFAFSLDGEIVYDNNIEIEVLPGALNMVVLK